MTMDKDTIIGCDPETIWRMMGTGYTGMLPAGMILDRLAKEDNPMITGSYKGYACIETEHGLIFADGASWELNPNPGNVPTVLDNLQGLLETSYQVKQDLSRSDRRIRMLVTPSLGFDLEMLAIWNDEQLMQFGCDPDKSIWPRDVDPSKVDAAKHSVRYFGGHIHLGYPVENPAEFYADMKNIKRMIVLADALLGGAGTILDVFSDGGGYQRRKVYGQPGVYRLQPHGIEYRTISNSWVMSRVYANNTLTLASYLPDLFKTDLPEYLLSDEKKLRARIIGGDYKGIKLLFSNIIRRVDDPPLKEVLRWFLTKAALRYPNYPIWHKEWNLSGTSSMYHTVEVSAYDN